MRSVPMLFAPPGATTPRLSRPVLPTISVPWPAMVPVLVSALPLVLKLVPDSSCSPPGLFAKPSAMTAPCATVKLPVLMKRIGLQKLKVPLPCFTSVPALTKLPALPLWYHAPALVLLAVSMYSVAPAALVKVALPPR